MRCFLYFSEIEDEYYVLFFKDVECCKVECEGLEVIFRWQFGCDWGERNLKDIQWENSR